MRGPQKPPMIETAGRGDARRANGESEKIEVESEQPGAGTEGRAIIRCDRFAQGSSRLHFGRIAMAEPPAPGTERKRKSASTRQFPAPLRRTLSATDVEIPPRR